MEDEKTSNKDKTESRGTQVKVKGQGELWTRYRVEKQLPMTGNK